MFLDLRLKISNDRDTRSSMTDWIKQAAQRTKAKRDKREQHGRAMKAQLSGFWTAFYSTIKNAVQEFNDEEGMGQIVKVEQASAASFTVSVRGGSGGSKLEVNVDPEKGIVRYTYTNPPGTSPGFLFFDVDSSGVLCFKYNEQQKSREEVARILLEPLFDVVY